MENDPAGRLVSIIAIFPRIILTRSQYVYIFYKSPQDTNYGLIVQRTMYVLPTHIVCFVWNTLF